MSNDSTNPLGGMLVAVVIALVAGLGTTYVVALLSPPPWDLGSVLIAVAIASAVGAAFAFFFGVRAGRG